MPQPDTQAPLTIGALARATGASQRSIRHYDAHGLLASTRAGNGYRSFAPLAVTQVRQIQKLISTGLNLAEIRSFPDCMLLVNDARSCPEATQIQRDRLAAIERQIQDLERRRTQLRAMLAQSAEPAAGVRSAP
ncbi:MerR family transcriptional regulator [Xylophilus sp.]|uniref:MerR family transcriptional regulator n=1 Tax=Xylophilus sp. TaxID=2653893 RepID=UPI0013B71831|nr:MerR family transcriptional regulator [Xylophilus sp.]KAF1045842.1 MAG: HTH-type transcriptional regulator CueR [Xylophilus sp.]